MTRFLLVLAALLLIACEPDPEENARAERASVVVLHQILIDADPLTGSPDRLEFVAACGGVAIDKDLIVTAAHCVPAGGTDHYPIVDRQQWFVHTDAQTDAIVVDRDEDRDLAWLEPHEDLAHWTDLAPVASAPPEVLLVRRFEVSRARFDGTEVSGVSFREGDSGAGAFTDSGALLGVILSCTETGPDDVCTTDRARLVRP